MCSSLGLMEWSELMAASRTELRNRQEDLLIQMGHMAGEGQGVQHMQCICRDPELIATSES